MLTHITIETPLPFQANILSLEILRLSGPASWCLGLRLELKGAWAGGAAELKAAELRPLTLPGRAEMGRGQIRIWGSRWLKEWLLEPAAETGQVRPDAVYF